MVKRITIACCLILCILISPDRSIAQNFELQPLIDSLQKAGNFPGMSVAIFYPGNVSRTFVAGEADKEKNIKIKSSDAFLQGSVGKTFVSAIALQLMQDGKLSPDDKVSTYLGDITWYKKIPNANDITVRMIMNHTSGVMRYEFKPEFTKDLTADPSIMWTPSQLLNYILDEKASFAAGEGWEYSDSNYILLGMIIEKITGKKFYAVLKEKILDPLQLNNTFPSDSRKLDKLVPGYAGADNPFGGKDKVIGDDGLFIINPQFEWTGGGIYSTTHDLAKWGKLLYEGKVIDTSLLFSAAVPAKLGRDVKYGLGVMIRQTPLGIGYGHGGYFPGYLTEMLYFPEKKLCVAVQVNSSDFKNLKIHILRCLIVIAQRAI